MQHLAHNYFYLFTRKFSENPVGLFKILTIYFNIKNFILVLIL